MTPSSEIAEKIVHGDWTNLSRGIKSDDWIELTKRIAAAIDLAKKEAVEENLKINCYCVGKNPYISKRCKGCHDIIETYWDIGDEIELARKAAFLRAAEIAENILGPMLASKNPVMVELCFEIAKAIRAEAWK